MEDDGHPVRQLRGRERDRHVVGPCRSGPEQENQRHEDAASETHGRLRYGRCARPRTHVFPGETSPTRFCLRLSGRAGLLEDMKKLQAWAGAILVGSASACAGNTPGAAVPSSGAATASVKALDVETLFAREA